MASVRCGACVGAQALRLAGCGEKRRSGILEKKMVRVCTAARTGDKLAKDSAADGGFR